MSSRSYLVLSSVVMFSAVAIGAFGAHTLRDMLTDRGKEVFSTASHYHFFHGLGLFIVPILVQGDALSVSSGQTVFLLFLLGIIIFSGSLYALAITGNTWLGAITPLGGLLLLAAWAKLGWSVFHHS